MNIQNMIIEALQPIYEQWLLDCFPEEISCKDDHYDLIDSAKYWEEFSEIVRKAL